MCSRHTNRTTFNGMRCQYMYSYTHLIFVSEKRGSETTSNSYKYCSLSLTVRNCVESRVKVMKVTKLIRKRQVELLDFVFDDVVIRWKVRRRVAF